MTITLESFGLDKLNNKEKLELVGQLWTSIVAAEPPGGMLTDAQRAELQRRVADAEANPEDFVTWDEAYTQTMERLKK